MPPPPLYDLNAIDFSRPVFDIEAIRRINPQRNQMEQLTAIVHVDREQNLIVGYKDVRDDEFWVKGHMPGFPLMPGVLICEAGAQLVGLYSKMFLVHPGSFIVFAGMENVRFRGQVKPGDRLWLAGKATKVNRRQVTNEVQGFVNGKMVFEGTMIGMPFNTPGAAAPAGAA